MQYVQAAHDQPPEHKAKADPQEERLMGRPSVFVCSYLLPSAFISVEHTGGNPKHDLGAQPVREDLRIGIISKLSIKLPLSSINRVQGGTLESRIWGIRVYASTYDT
jgi:hypothetical protein